MEILDSTIFNRNCSLRFPDYERILSFFTNAKINYGFLFPSLDNPNNDYPNIPSIILDLGEVKRVFQEYERNYHEDIEYKRVMNNYSIQIDALKLKLNNDVSGKY